MHDDSQRILQALADGQEVLGFNAAYLSSGLRRAFGEGAQAMGQLAQIRAMLLTPAELQQPLPPVAAVPAPQKVEAAPVAAVPPAPAAATDDVATTPAPSQTPEVAHATVAAVAGSPAVVAPAEPAVVEPSAPLAIAEPEPVAPPQAAVSSFIDDDRSEPLPSQTDDPDADGWRPSEDSMLLDEYVGLGLSLEEVAENHGRSIADIAHRLKTRHGVNVDVPKTEAPTQPVAVPVVPAVETAPAVPAPAPEATPVPPAAAATPAPAQPEEPPLDNYEAVIAQEMTRAGPEAVHFATGVLKHMERTPSAIAQLQDYLQTPKARTKLNDRLRLALLAKVVARLKTS